MISLERTQPNQWNLQLEPYPFPVTIRVLWRTEGRGDAERQILLEQGLEQGARGWEFSLPHGVQASYDGALFRMIWQLEVWNQNALLEVQEFRVGLDSPDPYRGVGLERNPFLLEVGAVEARVWVDRGSSDAPPVGAGIFWQILGVKGAGKSSHLQHWLAQTGGVYRYYGPHWTSRWTMPPVQPIAYWDEADRIPAPLLWLALANAARQKASIVAATHRDLALEARRAGLEVKTMWLERISPEQLLEWAELRIARVRLESGSNYRVTLLEAEEMLKTSSDSWRELGGVLHNHCAMWVRENSSR